MIQAQPDDLIGVEFSEADVQTAELLGYDLSAPELYDPLMGSALRSRLRSLLQRARKGIRKVAKRVRTRIRSRIAARRGGGGGTEDEGTGDVGATIRLPSGRIVRAGPGGVTVEDAARAAEAAEGYAPSGGIMETIKQNPLLVAVPAGLVLFMFMRKRR